MVVEVKGGNDWAHRLYQSLKKLTHLHETCHTQGRRSLMTRFKIVLLSSLPRITPSNIYKIEDRNQSKLLPVIILSSVQLRKI